MTKTIAVHKNKEPLPDTIKNKNAQKIINNLFRTSPAKIVTVTKKIKISARKLGSLAKK